MTETTIGYLTQWADQICSEADRLFQEYSGMHPANRPGSAVLFTGGQFWNDLPLGGKRIQATLLPNINHFIEMVQALARNNLPPNAERETRRSLEMMRSAIEQDTSTYWETKGEASEGFRALAAEVLSTLEEYGSGSTSDVLAVVDTNALVSNPAVESWQFDGVRHFSIILTPTVLSELDKLKINHSNEDVRKKAQSIIHRIKEYRRRGSLLHGVPVVKDRVSLRSIAAEPKMEESLPWLDPTNNDDRFLATALEIIRGNLRTTAFIVTSDINMQNKAEFARIPFREVPPAANDQEAVDADSTHGEGL